MSRLSRKGTTMCRAVKCRVCGKTTWAGCGMHVDAVRRGVPAGQWCSGHAASEAPRSRWNPFKR
ncbi:hypothetical protein BST42_01665 [Mycolicibacterium rhodesiae]|uniref:Uncharacterized protein n=1 Tax=Mycolicibacterium rhodesiae TaxID=36814 RepID=A0A1X0J575_MYCRH|nr:hypothetical protein BST42_01665 [Mycolicibacterium rhodesiae]